MYNELQEHAPLILGAVLAANNPEVRTQLEPGLFQMAEKGLDKLVDAIRGIWEGERNSITLCKDLDDEDSMVIQAILLGLADPDSLKPLEEAQTQVTIQQMVEKHSELISAAAAGAAEPGVRHFVESFMNDMGEDWQDLANAIRKILDGERDAGALIEGLDTEDTFIIQAILMTIENPDVLSTLANPQG